MGTAYYQKPIFDELEVQIAINKQQLIQLKLLSVHFLNIRLFQFRLMTVWGLILCAALSGFSHFALKTVPFMTDGIISSPLAMLESFSTTLMIVSMFGLFQSFFNRNEAIKNQALIEVLIREQEEALKDAAAALANEIWENKK